MKLETLIYEQIRKIIPENSKKTIFFAAINKTSYDIFFYSLIHDEFIQCFELVENNIIDRNELDNIFEAIVKMIRESKVFKEEKYNIVTIEIDKSGMELILDYYDKDIRMYKIKKEWIQKNIG